MAHGGWCDRATAGCGPLLCHEVLIEGASGLAFDIQVDVSVDTHGGLEVCVLRKLLHDTGAYPADGERAQDSIAELMEGDPSSPKTLR